MQNFSPLLPKNQKKNDCPWEAGKISQSVHDGCADLHGGAFAPCGCSKEKAHDGENDLPGCHTQGKHSITDALVFFWIKRCNGLGGAAAFRSWKKPPGSDDDQNEPERGNQQGKIR